MLRGPSPANSVTVFAPAGAPRSAESGPHGEPSSSSAKQNESFPGISEGRAIHLARPPAADVANHELERAADRRVRAVALAEYVLARVHAERAADRSVHDDHGPDGHRRREHAVNVELIVAGGFDRCDHHGQVLGLAARHHRVDRDLLDRARARDPAAPRRRSPAARASCPRASRARALPSAARPAGRRSSLSRRTPPSRLRARRARRGARAACCRSTSRAARRRDPDPPRASRSRAANPAAPRRGHARP